MSARNKFSLNAADLAAALYNAIDPEHLSEAQKVLLEADALQVAALAVGVIEEKTRFREGLQARGQQSPAYSVGRAGPHESELYRMIWAGDSKGVSKIVDPQEFSFTAHPSFGRSRGLAEMSRKLTDAISKMTLLQQQSLMESGSLPEEIYSDVEDILQGLKENAVARHKRTRADELSETVLDMIPEVFNCAQEQLAIIRERAGVYMEATFDASGKPQKPQFTSREQLEAAARTLPRFHSWFMDGDGKRTCHVYDSEFAIPAIMRKALDEYKDRLEKLPAEIKGMNQLKRLVSADAERLLDIEELARQRMEALNELHTAKAEYTEDTYGVAAKKRFAAAKTEAAKASKAYMDELQGEVSGETLNKWMRADRTSKIRDDVASILDNVYAGKIKLAEDQRHILETIYTVSVAYQAYPIDLQRRENAGQYSEVLEYLVESNFALRKKIAEAVGVNEEDLLAEMRADDPAVYSSVVNAMAESATSQKDVLGVRKEIGRSYGRLATKLEKKLRDRDAEVVTPLEYRELLALDALGAFHMAKLYPEACRGGFIIAEFGQPEIDTLRSGDVEAIREEVVRNAQNDMLLNITFAEAMAGGKVEIIPLHEDPSTMMHVAAARPNLRTGAVLKYLQKLSGIETEADLEEKAEYYLAADGSLKPLTAYLHLKRMGLDDKEMQERGFNTDELKETLVVRSHYDMEACSDNTKRASIIGLPMAEHSVREKNIAAAKCSIQVGEKKYIIYNPKYLGQGGNTARATGVPLDTQQATEQGEHLMGQTGETLAHENTRRTLGRLTMLCEVTQDRHGAALRFVSAIETGNPAGMLPARLTASELELMEHVAARRIASTRDDPRYDAYLAKYHGPAPNDSARADAKGTSKDIFNPGRAIGIAAKESGIWANIVALSEIFEFGRRGAAKGKPHKDNIRELQQWMDKDPTMRHIFTGAAMIVNIVDLERQWRKGGVVYENNGVIATVSKGDVSRPVVDLAAAYARGDSKLGVFDTADLTMAHLNIQYENLCKGLCTLFKKHKIADLIDPDNRKTVTKIKDIFAKVMDGLADIALTGDDRKIMERVYYVLFEAGNAVFPNLTVAQHAGQRTA